MSGNGAVWGRVRGRLRAFPERLAACRAEASTAPGGRLTKDLCVQEFKALRSCFAAAVVRVLPSGTLCYFNVPFFTEGQDDPKGRPLGWTSLHYVCVCCPQP
ncbi:NADH dehydrogenase [ubiquinone] 1 alpha subcomplex assembly factor 8 isoform X2 [Acinonyx jubatus]|uniref:NADH dehydrogenase [ubiquinone] 1 alpha subcomplex assembly factor 8 isoform X2 n=1 Tax=Acinonyx jubatus TaxID=32536 RepID=A0ABM3P940_ACIJB|nr:NADH dehydrogenase [ubiquinone] 1 alpha subcomplex assembly factor 8 isoform X2 [Acinonyx jubatus]